jgi:hypothetical protein
MPDKRYSKVEEEVLEILDRLEDERPVTRGRHLRVVPPPATRRPRTLPARIPRRRSRPVWFWLALSLGLAFMAVFVSDTAPDLVVYVLAIGSIMAFFAPLFTNRGPRPSSVGPTGTKTWRGRDIALGDSDNLGDRAQRWLDYRRGRPPRPPR